MQAIPRTPCRQSVCDQAAYDAQRRRGGHCFVACSHDRNAIVLKRACSEAASKLRSRQLAGRSLHPASRQAGRPGTLPRAPSRSAPRGPHLRARPFAPAHDAAPMRSLCGCGDYRRPAAEPRMGIPPAPPSAAIAAPKCGLQAGRHLQGDTRPRPLRLPLCYVFAVT